MWRDISNMECVKEDNQINRKKKIKKLTINFL